jgi:hypothetical protein
MLALSQQQIVGEKASCETWCFLFAEPDFGSYFFLRLMSDRTKATRQRRFGNRIRPELFASVEKTERRPSLN